MSSGPITLFDKSALQSLNPDESVWFDNFYRTVSHLCEVFEQHPVDEDVATAHFLQENELGNTFREQNCKVAVDLVFPTVALPSDHQRG